MAQVPLGCVNRLGSFFYRRNHVIFPHQGNVISTPAIKGTILPGITRKSILEVAQRKGFMVNYSSASWRPGKK